MAKTQKERAYLRDLYLGTEWTGRFTELVDKNFAFDDANKILYLNAGTGDHCFAIRERADKETVIFAVCDDEHLLSIARDKSAAIKADVDFSIGRFDDDVFDVVLADASLTAPKQIEDLVAEAVRVARVGGRVGFFLPSAGSFGEVFSLLWEVLFYEDMGEHGRAAEEMITAMPTVTRVEEIAAAAGLVDIQTHAAREVFEYENGPEFINSPLVSAFLLPVWLGSLGDDDKEKAMGKLSELIDAEDGDMSFRFSVKATLVTGKKIAGSAIK